MEKKKMVHYSHSFYKNQALLTQIIKKEQKLFSSLHINKSLPPDSVQVIQNFLSKSKIQQKIMAQQQSDDITQAFATLIIRGSQDRQLMQYILPCLDSLLSQSTASMRSLKTMRKETFNQLMNSLRVIALLQKYSVVEKESALHIRSIGSDLIGGKQSKEFIDILQEVHQKGQIRDYSYLLSLNFVLKYTKAAKIYFQSYKLDRIKQVIKNCNNQSQVVYTVLITCWLLSYIPQARILMSQKDQQIIKFVVLNCSKMQKQKIMRITIKLIKNLKVQHSCIQALVDGGFIRIIDSLTKGFIKDQELQKQMLDLNQVLQMNIKVLSSIDKYKKQVNQKSLDWGHVHTQKFWKQNVKKFDEDQFYLIKKVIELLKSKNSRTSAVACYDLGQFSRFYPYGKKFNFNQSSLNIRSKANYHTVDQVKLKSISQRAGTFGTPKDYDKQLVNLMIKITHYQIQN